MNNKKDNWFSWETWGGDKYEGEIVEYDGDTIYVKCTDGITRPVDISNNNIIEVLN